MAVWEYKVISSGKGGFATPALLESFLNQLGTDEWAVSYTHLDTPTVGQKLDLRSAQLRP